MKITPVLVVDEIESSLPFWVERLGFEKLVEVPEGDRLGFVILARENSEIMLQTAESVRKDTGEFMPNLRPGGVGLFIEVSDFNVMLKNLEGYPIALGYRTTTYGMREVGVHAPGGHPIIFAAQA